jgi:DNA-binding GntR family transcriptional regulator
MTPRATTTVDATRRVIGELRQKIFRHELLPGQHIRQEDLAEQMGVSRSPLREALTALETEGIVRHVPNQGFFVVRLRSGELDQIYHMRELLESTILRSVEKPTSAALDRLRAINDELSQVLNHGPIATVLDRNREFHFQVFELSPMDFVTATVMRLWNLSEAYRATYLSLPDAETRDRILREHIGFVDALERFDIDELLAVANRHRDAGKATVERLLLAQEPPPPSLARDGNGRR